MGLRVVPMTFVQASTFVDAVHRHHRAPVGHKFSIGVHDRDVLVGVAIVGRPVARMLDDGLTLEVTRVATDGTKNAPSMLYSSAWRAAKALGYLRMVTYTQPEAGETGASLRAAGWRIDAELRARPGWSTGARKRISRGVDEVARWRWLAPGAELKVDR